MSLESSHKVLGFKVVNSKTAQVAVRVTKANRQAELNQIVKKIPNFTVVAGSERLASKAGQYQDVVFVTIAKKAQTKPATAVQKARFIETSSNQFMDPSNHSIWAEEGGMLVRTDNIESAEKLAEILTASVCSREQQISVEGTTTASTLNHGVEIESGYYAQFNLGPAMHHGYILALNEDRTEAVVLPFPDDQNSLYPMARINTGQITEAHDLEKTVKELPVLPSSEQHLALAADAIPTLSQAKAYYEKIYSYNRPFFTAFVKMMTERHLYL